MGQNMNPCTNCPYRREALIGRLHARIDAKYSLYERLTSNYGQRLALLQVHSAAGWLRRISPTVEVRLGGVYVIIEKSNEQLKEE